MKISAFAVFAFTVLLAACASGGGGDPVYSGEYFYNFENAVLTPDGKDEDWCLKGISMAPSELPAKESSGPWGTSHVVLRGKLGPRGSYGGLGRCKHELEVTEILKVTNMRGRDG
jgi:hypothetical protein